MKSELLAKSPMLALPLIALFLFIAVFIAMFVITMRKRAPAFDPLARMPLDDDEEKRSAVMSDVDPTVNKVIHEVDGIEEYDNKLPNWWLYILYGSVVFAVGYWFIFHTSGFGDTPRVAYDAEMNSVAMAEAANAKLTGPVTAESLTTLSKNRGIVARGKQVFVTTCAACHRADGGGVVGPNLTDEFWLHGSAPDKVYKSVSQGVPDKGMPAWGPQLGAERVQAVTAYVLTLRGTNVTGGKAPQGERETLSQR